MNALLPSLVYQMCVHGALIAGSQARKMAGDAVDPNDWDLIVPFDKWQTIALMIPEEAVPNKFGGWRFTTTQHDSEEDVEVDVWPGDVITYLTECKTKNGGSVYVVDYIKNRIFTSQVKDLSETTKVDINITVNGAISQPYMYLNGERVI